CCTVEGSLHCWKIWADEERAYCYLTQKYASGSAAALGIYSPTPPTCSGLALCSPLSLWVCSDKNSAHCLLEKPQDGPKYTNGVSSSRIKQRGGGAKAVVVDVRSTLSSPASSCQHQSPVVLQVRVKSQEAPPRGSTWAGLHTAPCDTYAVHSTLDSCTPAAPGRGVVLVVRHTTERRIVAHFEEAETGLTYSGATVATFGKSQVGAKFGTAASLSPDGKIYAVDSPTFGVLLFGIHAHNQETSAGGPMIEPTI
ncbi:unnamed protein product, partial [Amoebophrya sp. A25]